MKSFEEFRREQDEYLEENIGRWLGKAFKGTRKNADSAAAAAKVKNKGGKIKGGKGLGPLVGGAVGFGLSKLGNLAKDIAGAAKREAGSLLKGKHGETGSSKGQEESGLPKSS
jgi:Sec-independent protein translocase protein TatA